MTLFTFLTPPRVLLAGLGLLGLLAGCESRPSSSTNEEKTAADGSAAGSGEASSRAAEVYLTAAADTSAPLRYIRRNAASPEAAADLAALALAMKKMRQMRCDSGVSWYYQGAIHNVPSTIGKAPGYNNPFCDVYTTGKPTLFGWNGCTHDPAGISTYHFLIWHRLYTWHLEKIVRKLSGKKDFALPYWNYTSAANYVMPAPFRLPADSVSNSLYERDRYQPLNQGRPINPAANQGLPPGALDTALIFKHRSYRAFNLNINNAPHGAMHNYIGAGPLYELETWNPIRQDTMQMGLMGQVATAAFDPIFWAHHSNIDYLWTRWSVTRQGYGKLPLLDSMKANPWPHYQFMTPEGKPVTYSYEQALQLALNPDYQYDVLLPTTQPLLAKRTRTTRRLALMTSRPPQEGPLVPVASATPRKALAAGQFTVQLSGPAEKLTQLKSTAQKSAAQPATDRRLMLQVVVSATHDPHTSYSVYVRSQLPAGRRMALATRPQLAGILNFFGLGHQHGAGGEMKGMAMPTRLSRTFLFDVTDLLDPTGLQQGKLDIELVPAVAKAPVITIDKVTLLTQDN